MRTWQANDVLDAAVQTLINDRCHRAYMHEMRGGLQAVYTSLEVLARSAKSGGHNAALIDNASSLAKRAMAHHEQALTDIINQVTRPESAAEVVDMASLLQQAQQFLRNDALSKGISLRLSSSENVLVLIQKNKLRALLLGLLATGIDASPAGAELHIELSRVDSFALLELRSEFSYGAILDAEELFCSEPRARQPQDLVLGFVRHWIAAKGGRVEIHAPTGEQAGLHIYYPLAAA
jgi:signal transduction histidine kinase